MNASETREHHESEAARLRALLATATTPGMKARLTEEAEKHEAFAEGVDRERAELETEA